MAGSYPTKVDPVAMVKANKRKHRLYKLAKTGIMVAVYGMPALTMGLGSVGMPSMRARLGFTVAEISRAFSVRNLGAMAGTLLSGVLNDRFSSYADLIVSASCTLSALAFAAEPWMYSIPLLAFFYFMQGIGEGALDPVLSFSIFNMWGPKADAPMYMVHFGWVVCSLIAPNIARPFIISDSEVLPNITNSSVDATMIPDLEGGQIQFAYLTVSAIMLVMALIFLVLHFFKAPQDMEQHMPEKQSFRQVFQPGSCADGHACFAMIIVVLIFFYYFFGDVSVNYYMYSFTVESEELEFSQSEALNLQSYTAVAMAASRGLLVIISPFIHVNVIIFTLIFLKIGTLGILSFWGSTNRNVYFVTRILHAIIIAPLFPVAKMFTSKMITVTSVVVAITIIGDSLGAFVFDVVIGQLYDMSKISILYMGFGNAILLALIISVMYIVAKIHFKRHPRPLTVIDTKEVVEIETIRL